MEDHPHALQRLSDAYGVDVGGLRVLDAELDPDLPDGAEVPMWLGIECEQFIG